MTGSGTRSIPGHVLDHLLRRVGGKGAGGIERGVVAQRCLVLERLLEARAVLLEARGVAALEERRDLLVCVAARRRLGAHEALVERRVGIVVRRGRDGLRHVERRLGVELIERDVLEARLCHGGVSRGRVSALTPVTRE